MSTEQRMEVARRVGDRPRQLRHFFDQIGFATPSTTCVKGIPQLISSLAIRTFLRVWGRRVRRSARVAPFFSSEHERDLPFQPGDGAVVHVKNPGDSPAAFAGRQALECLSLLVVTKLGLANNLCRCPKFERPAQTEQSCL